MADDDDEEEDEKEDAEDGDGEDDESSGGGKKKLILFIVIGVVVLLIAGGATAYFLGAFDSSPGGSDDAEVEENAGDAAATGGAEGGGEGQAKRPRFNPRAVGIKYELPELALQLKPEGRQPHAALVRVTLMLVRAEEEDIQHLDQSTAKITEALQQAAAELPYADMRGSSGPYLLREAMLKRVPPIAKPVAIRDILITNLIVQ
jgi:flagellar FliL protein